MARIKNPQLTKEYTGLPRAIASGSTGQKKSVRRKAKAFRFTKPKRSSKAKKQVEEQKSKKSKPAKVNRKQVEKQKSKKSKPAKVNGKQVEEQKSKKSNPAKVNGKEISSVLQEKFLIDGRCRFVYELFKTVKELKSPRFEDEDLPIPERNLIFFEKRHKEAVQKHVRNQAKNYSDFMEKFVSEGVNMEVFEECLQAFQNEYKPDGYSETGFVTYCSAIAFLGNYFVDKGILSAWEGAFMYVFNLLTDTLEKSKYQCDLVESSW